jgi:cell fate (sporulation/competence/biofilm development) regulator YmcA (YheA/YmcA/DUF963 family)
MDSGTLNEAISGIAAQIIGQRIRMTFETRQLLLQENTTVTCPQCANEFTLDQGFAKKALEQLEHASADAITAMRDAERENVEKRAQQIASEQTRAAQGEAENFKKLLKEQAAAHATSLAEVRTLTEQSVAPRVEELRRALAEQGAQLQTLRSREDSLVTRERDLETRVDA